MPTRYSSADLELLLSECRQGASLSQLERALNRTAGGLTQKLVVLSRQDPETWDPDRVKKYIREHFTLQVEAASETRKARYKAQVISYLQAHPDATSKDLDHAGLGWAFLIAYAKTGMASARRDAGIDRNAVIIERKKEQVRAYLRSHPDANRDDLVAKKVIGNLVFKNLYPQGIEEARKDAGILNEGDISSAECARRLGISREYVSQLVDAHQLDGYRVGRWLRIRMESVEARLGSISGSG
ncbi:TPA: helix-turn-helix domain-containing protein [Candidatus Woesearchaeota archaeon]|nr:helix-turn-helix domain-containing protein [Candidatus Woesearchaeota archaeon]